MRKYTVTGTITCTVGITVVAESEDAALSIAEEEFGGVIGFCGNGGTDKLIGVYGTDEFIACDDEPEWDDVEEGEEVEADEDEN